MADTTDNANETEENAPPSEPVAGRSSLLGKLRILLLIAAIIVLECLAAWLYLPSATQTAALAGVTPAAAADSKSPKPAATKLEEGLSSDESEVDLGEFCVTAFQSTSNTTLRIDFHLYGTVKTDSQKDLLKLMEDNKHRFREQVLVIVRGAEITDLTDAGLGLMKRKILDRANRTLGKPLLQTVVVSDFSFIEQ